MLLVGAGVQRYAKLYYYVVIRSFRVIPADDLLSSVLFFI